MRQKSPANLGSARNEDLKTRTIITEDGVCNVRRKFVAEGQAKLMKEQALPKAADKPAPGGILKTKMASPGAVGATQSAAAHVSLNIETTSK